MKLYAHQKAIIDDDPLRCGLWLGTGSGKTRVALMLAVGKTLVICPKTQKEDGNWERELITITSQKTIGITELQTITFDTFKRDAATLPRFDTVIVDECHGCLGVTPNTRQRKRVTIPKASQRFDALDEYLYRNPPERLYLCTATLVKSPMTVWAAHRILKPELCPDFIDFRNEFYTQLPMPGRSVFAPKSDSVSKDKIAAIVKSLGYVGRLEDYFDVPEQTFITRHVELTADQKTRLKSLKLEYPDPLVRIGKQHQIENGVLAGDEYSPGETFSNGKIDTILEYAEEFPRMVVFAKYRAQIDSLFTACERRGLHALVLTGSTRDRGGVIARANTLEKCIFIVQAQISAGWELPHYPIMIFASRTYSFVDYDQALGRIQRANNIKKNLYINLVVKGGIDEAVDRSLVNKSDFSERVYANIKE